MQPHDIRNPDGSFMNEQQIVEHVAANLSAEDRAYIAGLKSKYDMIGFHFGVGTVIRNAYASVVA
jgi:hypothetical protein